MGALLDNSSAGGQTANGLGGTFTVTINALSDTWLFLFLSYNRISSAGLAVTVAGNACTLIGSAGNTTEGIRTEIWAYQPLATGAQTASVTWTTNNHRVAYSWVSYTGVDPTTPFGTPTTHANASGSGAVQDAITTTSGDVAIFALTGGYTGTTNIADTGDTVLRNADTGTAMHAYSSYQLASGSSTTVGVASLVTARNYCSVAVAVKQVTPPTPISGSDTGTGTEGTPTIVGSYAQSDSAAATEGTPTLTGNYAETDTGAATEGTPTLTGAYAEADSGVATEGTPGLTGSYAQSDTGTATEGTPTLAGAYADADTATATEGVPTLTAGYAETDTGTATEGESLTIIPAPRGETSRATVTLEPAPYRVRLTFPAPSAAVSLRPTSRVALALASPYRARLLPAPAPTATVTLEPAPRATVTLGGQE